MIKLFQRTYFSKGQKINTFYLYLSKNVILFCRHPFSWLFNFVICWLFSAKMGQKINDSPAPYFETLDSSYPQQGATTPSILPRGFGIALPRGRQIGVTARFRFWSRQSSTSENTYVNLFSRLQHRGFIEAEDPRCERVPCHRRTESWCLPMSGMSSSRATR